MTWRGPGLDLRPAAGGDGASTVVGPGSEGDSDDEPQPNRVRSACCARVSWGYWPSA